MNRFKRCVSLFTTLVMTFTFVVSQAGCSMKEFFTGKAEEAIKEAIDDGTLSNEKWLEMINDAFGIEVPEGTDVVENAKDWGFINNDENVEPEAKLDSQFATKTLVKAAGLAGSDASDEEIIQTAIEHGLISSVNSMSDPAGAIESLDKANDYWMHREFEYKEDIQYAEHVKDLSSALKSDQVKINEAEGKITMPSEYAEDLVQDSVYILPPDEEYKDGRAMKVLNIKKNSDGTTTVLSIPATLEEVYSKLNVQGTFSPEYEDIEVIDDSVKINEGGVEKMSADGEEYMIRPLSYTGFDENKIEKMSSVPSFTIEVPIKSKKSGSNGVENTGELFVFATFSDIQINSDVDIDFHLFKSPDVYVYSALDYKETVGLKLSGTREGSQDFDDAFEGLSDADMITAMNGAVFEGEVDVARVPVQICPGISIDLVVSFVVSANGYISVELSHNHTKGFELINGHIRIIKETSKGDLSLQISASVAVYVSFKIELRCTLVKESLVTLDLRVGPKLEGTLKLYSDMVCADISGYMEITLTLEFHKIIDKILKDPRLTFNFMDGDTEGNGFSGHLEIKNFKPQIVSECTHGKDTDVTEPEVTEAPIPIGNLHFEKTYYAVSQGSSIKLSFKSKPATLELSDLTWSSSDDSIVSVDQNGNITASGAGSATITVKSSDGLYSATCFITVKADEGSASQMKNIIFSRGSSEIQAA